MNKLIAWLTPKVDKVAYFGVGYIVATILPIPAMWGLIIAVAVAVFKEYWDWKSKKGNPDIWDFVATVLGGCLGYAALMMW